MFSDKENDDIVTFKKKLNEYEDETMDKLVDALQVKAVIVVGLLEKGFKVTCRRNEATEADSMQLISFALLETEITAFLNHKMPDLLRLINVIREADRNC